MDIVLFWMRIPQLRRALWVVQQINGGGQMISKRGLLPTFFGIIIVSTAIKKIKIKNTGASNHLRDLKNSIYFNILPGRAA